MDTNWIITTLLLVFLFGVMAWRAYVMLKGD